MVHLYSCTICRKKIPADDNRITCSECGSDMCGSCYLRKKTSHFHREDHFKYMIAEASGSMYVRPPDPPMRMANKAPKTKNSVAATKKRASRKRKLVDTGEGDLNRPAAATQTGAGPKQESFSHARANKCERCKKHHQRCSGPTEDGWCLRCRMKYDNCDFIKPLQDSTTNKEPSSELSTSLPGSSTSPQPTESTSSALGPSDGLSTSEDRESSESNSTKPAIRRRLVCRRNMPDYMFDE